MFIALKRRLRPPLKRLAKTTLSFSGRLLSRLEYKSWHEFPRDGLYTSNRLNLFDDRAFLDLIDPILKQGAMGDGSGAASLPLSRMYMLWQLVRTCEGVPGDLIEFGSYRGACAYVMLAASRSWSDDKTAFLYDTFAGIPSAGLTEKESRSEFAGRFNNTSVESVRAFLTEFSQRIELRPGLVPETLDDTGPSAVAFMHVDLNAAKPTLAALEWAYPRLSDGGICLLDDYLGEEYPEQRALVEAYFTKLHQPIVGLPTGQGFVIKRARMERG